MKIHIHIHTYKTTHSHTPMNIRVRVCRYVNTHINLMFEERNHPNIQIYADINNIQEGPKRQLLP